MDWDRNFSNVAGSCFWEGQLLNVGCSNSGPVLRGKDIKGANGESVKLCCKAQSQKSKAEPFHCLPVLSRIRDNLTFGITSADLCY